MINFEVIWDGTPARGGRYLFAQPERTRPATRGPAPAPILPGKPSAIRLRSKRETEPLKIQIYRLLLARDMAIADIVEHFKGTYSQSRVYGSFATLRATGHVRVVRRERRPRKGSNGPMLREIYGPCSGTVELSLKTKVEAGQ